jgi:predicted Zn-dependent protease
MKTREEEIRNMLEEQPDDAFLHYALALECIYAGRMDEGIQILENLREKSPDYLGLYYKLGQTYGFTGQTKKAEAVFESGIRLAEHQQQFKTRDELKNALQLLRDDHQE